MVKVFSFTENRDNILDYPVWHLQKGQSYRPYQVVEGRMQGKAVVAKLASVDEREQARALMGQSIVVPRSELPRLPVGEYYWSQLMGLAVYDRQDQCLGKIEDIFETGANDVLVVRGHSGVEVLIPYADAVVLAVDLAAQRMQVDWQADY